MLANVEIRAAIETGEFVFAPIDYEYVEPAIYSMPVGSSKKDILEGSRVDPGRQLLGAARSEAHLK